MLKIGIIGLGDIAQKAYLPIISKRGVEAHLCTRNESILLKTSEQYRFSNVHSNLESLVNSGIQGAFVHTSTASHYSIVEKLLSHNIPVYVDKPVTYDYASTERLFGMAMQKNVQLHVGFNRRYAPAYQQLKALLNPNMIIMQKNRRMLPADVRTFIFDDFIHVIDTMLFLFPYPVAKLNVAGRRNGSTLYHVVIEFVADNGSIAIGIMNRDSGTEEEKLEVFNAEEKRAVYNLVDVVGYRDRNETRSPVNTWEPTLFKRGFDQIIDNFLLAIDKKPLKEQGADALLTHKVCEEVVVRLNEE